MRAAGNFHDTVFKLHGVPDSVVSDRDLKYTSKFWESFMDLLPVDLKMSKTTHPQTDGQAEVMNLKSKIISASSAIIIRMIGMG